MRVTRHTDPDGFLAAAAPVLARGEASGSMFGSAAHALKRVPAPDGERVYLATCGDGRIAGVALQRATGPVIVGASDPEAAVAFADDLAPEHPGLPGVVGTPEAGAAFAARWGALTGRTSRLRLRMRQHVLTAVSDVPAASGAVREATIEDAEWLAAQQVAFFAEVGVPDPPERAREIVGRGLAQHAYRIWDDGTRVACAGFNDAAPEFARIAPVYTVPEGRGRGYATALVAAVAHELLARGKRKLFLTTDIANPTSNAIYARIGFRAESDDWHLDFVAAAE